MEELGSAFLVLVDPCDGLAERLPHAFIEPGIVLLPLLPVVHGHDGVAPAEHVVGGEQGADIAALELPVRGRERREVALHRLAARQQGRGRGRGRCFIDTVRGRACRSCPAPPQLRRGHLQHSRLAGHLHRRQRDLVVLDVQVVFERLDVRVDGVELHRHRGVARLEQPFRRGGIRRRPGHLARVGNDPPSAKHVVGVLGTLFGNDPAKDEVGSLLDRELGPLDEVGEVGLVEGECRVALRRACGRETGERRMVAQRRVQRPEQHQPVRVVGPSPATGDGGGHAQLRLPRAEQARRSVHQGPRLRLSSTPPARRCGSRRADD